ncbi:keratin-associated protein 3-3 [Neomonachus schauinslandi]|uniref:Keratin-associated protein 3-3 n=2 Tax=Carnivora TaxID=33554 RepID=A0A8M1MUN9_NEOSC|nr:keratin-associated protein 3-3 [Neomonachus schauinslandi]XP_044777576.1 keratin-associated protein 3-3 [Neomonachus schauinslandi]
MACCVPCCCSVPTGPATTICSSDKCCRCGVCLPSTCPHTTWLLEPTCCDNSPPPCHIPQPCVPTCFLLNSSYPTPGLETINLTTFTQPSGEPCIPSSC